MLMDKVFRLSTTEFLLAWRLHEEKEIGMEGLCSPRF